MNACLALLPLAWCSWFAWFRKREQGRLDALLKASLAYVLLCFGIVEGQSLFHALAAPATACLWALSAAAPFLLPAPPSTLEPPGFPARRLSRLESACLAVVGLIGLICLVLGFWLPQWNVDAQLYHLPRMEEWVQERCLALFPTPYDFQDFLPPGAEYVSLQFRLLLGFQALAFLGQWTAWLLVGASTAAVTRALGGGTRAQVLAWLAWATLPMAVLQSCVPQSDLLAAFGLSLTAYFCVRHDQDTGAGWDLWAAAAAGAALLLKGTNYLFVPAFALWTVLRRDRTRPWAGRLALLALLAAAPNLPFWGRNLALCGQALGNSVGMHGVAHPGPASMLSNGIKALGDELSLPSRTTVAAVARAVRWIHARMGLPMDRPDWVYAPALSYDYYAPLRALWNEQCAGDPLQTLALLALLAAALLRPWRQAAKTPGWTPLGRYLAACLAGGLLFLALVRWNIWGTRLHLPLYACAAPLLGLGLDRLKRPALVWACAALFAAQGLWAACDNDRRPLFLLGHSYARLRGDYDGFVSGYNAARLGKSIGLLEPVRCCPEYAQDEYGVWWGAQWAGSGARIQHLTASPATGRLLHAFPWNAFRPDIIAADSTTYKTEFLDWGGRRWRRLGDDGAWAVYLPGPGPRSRPPNPGSSGQDRQKRGRPGARPAAISN